MKIILITPTSDGTNSTYMRGTKRWYDWFVVSWEILERNGYNPLLVMYRGKAYLARNFKDAEPNVFAKNQLADITECNIMRPEEWFHLRGRRYDS